MTLKLTILIYTWRTSACPTRTPTRAPTRANAQYFLARARLFRKFDQPAKQLTCSFKVSAKLEPFPYAAFRVHRKSSLDVIHLDPSRGVWTLPEQTIYKNLWRYVNLTVKSNISSMHLQMTYKTLSILRKNINPKLQFSDVAMFNIIFKEKVKLSRCQMDLI